MNRYLAEAQRLLLAGEFAAAAEQCRKSIAMGLDPQAARGLLADCHYNLGVHHNRATGLSEDAEAQFRRALEVDPRHADAANNLGAMLLMKGQGEAALPHFAAALAQAPNDVRYAANLARALVQAGRLDAASKALSALARLDPANAGAYHLCDALLVSDIVPDADYPARVRQEIAARLSALETQNHLLADPLVFPATYFPLSYHGLGNVDIVRRLAALHLRWNPALGDVAPHIRGWKRPAGRARIGIASRFLRDHSIGNTSRGLVERLDRARFEVTVVRFEPSRGDETSRAIDAAADAVVTLPAQLDRAREALAAQAFDILFYQDVGMEPLSYCLALARLAPVQLTSFGHPDTTGIPNIDYFLSSSLYEPPGASGQYSEKLVTLEGMGTLAYYHRPQSAAPRPSRESLGLGDVQHLYLCPQTLFKIQPEMDGLFAAIAERDPLATIVLIEAGHRSMRPALERRWQAQVPQVAGRIRFVPAMPFKDYLGLVASADVILDTVHFNGQNTTLEALALDIPVVTWPRAFQRGRHGLGMYAAMGFTELVATDAADYASKAVRVATDAAFRVHCVERIVATRGVLFESDRFIRAAEAALETMLAERSPLE
jgi:protein O-GlcNAc transferase